jgi:serine/threonine protein kinase
VRGGTATSNKSNVFLSPQGLVKIIDPYRPSLTTRSGSETSGPSGTPAYMAPEQALALPTDERADLYAVGGILFRVLSGAPPFRGAALLEVLRQQIEDPAPPVTSPHGSLPDVLTGCVARALAKRPDDRFGAPRRDASRPELALVLLGGKAEGR